MMHIRRNVLLKKKHGLDMVTQKHSNVKYLCCRGVVRRSIYLKYKQRE